MTPDVSHSDLANALRLLSVDAVEKANSGHPGMPMGMADVAAVLWGGILKHDPAHPDWPDRDRFVLSAGHGSMLLYALLHLTGYPDITLEEMQNFRQLGSRTAGHPEYGHAAGIETTTGPLGQGLANAVGMALSEKLLRAQFGEALVDHYTYAVVGDGCLMEGISHEAASIAGHLRLDRLIVLFDDNGISIDGPTDLTVSDDQCKRFAALGWDAEAVDGHDADAIRAAILRAKESSRPSFIACRTTIAWGAPTKAGKNTSHGSPLGKDEVAGLRHALGWDHEPFLIPPKISQAWATHGADAKQRFADWSQRLDETDESQRSLFLRLFNQALPEGWNEAVETAKKAWCESPRTEASRVSSNRALDLLAEVLPELLGGSADLSGSNGTLAKHLTPISADTAGRYIHYGVREHAMAAMMNGIALHGGFIPFGGTFLVFSDYSRPSIRLSALMNLRVVHVMTHDSIGVGEDGPTHQPVEHLASLRAIPGLHVYRPCDPVETLECWALSVARRDGPSLLALSRQNLPAVRTEYGRDNKVALGGYVLREASAAPRVVLMATGSEIAIALDAAQTLEARGLPTRIVSIPCFERFDEQGDAYIEETLGGADAVRIGIEAALRMGWERYLGPKGHFVGMKGFGASGPAPEVYRHFGITADSVVALAVQHA